MANRIAGLILLYLTKDINRINDIANKYNVDINTISDINPEIGAFITKKL